MSHEKFNSFNPNSLPSEDSTSPENISNPEPKFSRRTFLKMAGAAAGAAAIDRVFPNSANANIDNTPNIDTTANPSHIPDEVDNASPADLAYSPEFMAQFESISVPQRVLETVNRTDGLVGQINRSWVYGPEARFQYVENNQRFYVYDKGVLSENPDQNADWKVLESRQAYEMVKGEHQVGKEYPPRPPAEVPVAGDLNNPNNVTFKAFNSALESAAIPQGWKYTQTIDKNGTISDNPDYGKYNVTAAHFDDVTNHNVASNFWDFMNSRGPVIINGQRVENQPLFPDPYFVTGRPVTEAYWTKTVVGGQEKDVMVQVFERRVMTYTPSNSEGWQVEMGNTGLQYKEWLFPGEGGVGGGEEERPYAEMDKAGAERIAMYVNQYRKEHGLPELKLQPELAKASEDYAKFFMENGNLRTLEQIHYLDGAPWDRAHKAGYGGMANENLSLTLTVNPDGSYRDDWERVVVDGWIQSQGHLDNMMNPQWKEFGSGCYTQEKPAKELPFWKDPDDKQWQVTGSIMMFGEGDK